MRLDSTRPLDLTYCTNIHAADGWPAVDANIRRFAPALKARFAPTAPFGLGLRLSARDADELQAGHLDEFRAFLDREGLYVAIINGFPYGSFHRSVVKAEVYAPDWRDDRRVQYTLGLFDILRQLLPAGVQGGVSTAPLSYKAWMPHDRKDDWHTVTANVARVAARLAELRERTGQVLHLDIEPEPDCTLETIDETIDFFERWLWPEGARIVVDAIGGTVDAARRALADHVRVCFDCCHVAVEYEDPVQALDRLDRAGVRIGRVQLSSALTVPRPSDAAHSEALAQRLRAFADSTYLHQVIECRDGHFRHLADLGPALDEPGAPGAEWRIHFHVPLFTDAFGALGSTQGVVHTVLQEVGRRDLVEHLEIETYTWDVLPAELKVDLLDSIGREYEWVLANIGSRDLHQPKIA